MIVVVVLVVLGVVMLGGVARQATGARWTRRRPPPVPRAATAVGSARSIRRRWVPPSIGRRARACPIRAVMAGLIGVGAAALVGPVPLLVSAGGVVVVRRTLRIVRQRRARLDIERSIPDTIELFVLLVHAGLTPVRAVHELTSVAPAATRDGFAAVVHRLDRGEPFGDALAALPERVGPGMVVLIDLVASADRHGSPLGPMLESLAHEARSARRRQHEADARRLPVRLSFPLVSCTLPSFVLLAIAPALLAALSSISLSV